MSVLGIPKTVDNDIPSTDRCPGFGSTAQYVAQSVRDLGMDVRALPQPVSIFETMGRGVGWLAAASVLARLDDQSAPHLVYLPERAFDVQRFLAALDRVVGRLGYAVVVVSEGLQTADGKPVFEIGDLTQRNALNRALPGGVGSYLAERRNAGAADSMPLRKTRALRPFVHAPRIGAGPGRCRTGRAGRRARRRRRHRRARGFITRLDDSTPDAGYGFVPLSSASGEKKVPASWIADDGTGVSSDFIHYAAPIVGDLLPYACPLTRHRPTGSK